METVIVICFLSFVVSMVANYFFMKEIWRVLHQVCDQIQFLRGERENQHFRISSLDLKFEKRLGNLEKKVK